MISQGRNKTQDQKEPYPMEELTTAHDHNQGSNATPDPTGVFSQVELLGHCTFCLRSTSKGGKEESALKLSNDAQDLLLVVPEATSLSSTLLATLNQIWGPLLKTKPVKIDDLFTFLESTGRSEIMEKRMAFPSLPKMCRLCAERLELVNKLLRDLLEEINSLRKIMIESKPRGKHSWRAGKFEKALTNSNLEQEVILATLKFLDPGKRFGGPNATEQLSNIRFDPVPKKMLKKSTQNIRKRQEPPTSFKLDFMDVDSIVKIDDASNAVMPQPEQGPTCYVDNNEEGEFEIPFQDLLVANNIEASAHDPLQLLGNDPLQSTSTCTPTTFNDKISSMKPNDGYDEKRYDVISGSGDNSDSDYIKSEDDEDDYSSNTQDEGDMHDFSSLQPSQTTEAPITFVKRKVLGFKRPASRKPNNPRNEVKSPAGEDLSGLEPHNAFNSKVDGNTGVVTISCLINNCGKEFKTKNASLPFKRHQQQVHNYNGYQTVICEICSKSYRCAVSLVIHKASQHPKNKIRKPPRQKCDICKGTILIRDMYEHIRAHVGDDYVTKCPNPECHFSCSQPSTLAQHILDIKACKDAIPDADVNQFLKPSYTCEHCDFQTTNEDFIQNHLTNQHETSTKNISCPISGCSQEFTVKQSVLFHLPRHDLYPCIIGVDSQRCADCSQKIKLGRMEAHLKEKHKVMEFVLCKQCPHIFSSKDHLLDHLEYRHRFGVMSCDICNDGVKFPRHLELREHYFKEHQIGKQFLCEQCDTICWSLKMLKDHAQNEHNKTLKLNIDLPIQIQKKSFPCKDCDTICKSKTSLRYHNIKFHGARPWTCGVCSETFNKLEAWRRHELEHSGMLPPPTGKFKCPVEGCDKVYVCNQSLKTHNAWDHVGRRENVCDVCGKAYKGPQGLKNHKEIVHLGLRPFVCETCGDSFSTKAVLKTHMRIHSGERRFACEICGQRFGYSEVLQRHLEGHAKKGADFKPNGPMKGARKRVERTNKTSD